MDAPIRRYSHRSAAFSLVETLFALAIGTMSLTAAFTLNSNQLRLVMSTRESGAASLTLEERVEQLRIATWRQITDGNYLTKTYFATVPKSISPLNAYSEQVTVSAWPDAAVCPPLVVEKRKDSPATILSPATTIADQRLAKVDVRITWKSSNARVRTRELTTIISNGGISRMNLPAMGNAAGVPPTGSTPPPSSSSASATPPPSSSSSSSTPTPTPIPVTATPAATPKANGRGNVGGKPGKA